MKNLTLLIPAKDESESLPTVIEELKKFDCKKKIILSSKDLKTIDAIRNEDVEIIYQKQNGFGDALIMGINNLDTEYFMIFNADGSFNPSEIPKMFELLDKNSCDFVFASRYQEDSGSDDDTFVTYLGNKIFTFLGKILFKLDITDLLYTYVLGKSEKVKKLNLTQKDFSFCVELPIKAKKENMKMISSNSYERKRIDGVKKVNAVRDGTLILIHMIRLFFSR
tara:strand:+ start:2458 stop:3126 length:669 start_codon:yes stop_codon:yes gene_type:complete